MDNTDDKLTSDYLIEYLKSNIGIISLFFYGLGITYLFTYYILIWKINIIEYITITDTLLIPLKFLFYLIIIVLLYNFITRLILKIHLKGKSEKSADYKFRLLIGATVFPMFMMIIENQFTKGKFYTIEYMFFAFFGVIYLLIRNRKSIEFFNNTIKIVIFCSFVLVFLKAQFDCFNNSNFSYQSEFVTFEYENKIYIQSDSLIYIGQTENYTYLLDKANNEKLILPRSDIKNYSIHRKD